MELTRIALRTLVRHARWEAEHVSPDFRVEDMGWGTRGALATVLAGDDDGLFYDIYMLITACMVRGDELRATDDEVLENILSRL